MIIIKRNVHGHFLYDTANRFQIRTLLGHVYKEGGGYPSTHKFVFSSLCLHGI